MKIRILFYILCQYTLKKTELSERSIHYDVGFICLHFGGMESVL